MQITFFTYMEDALKKALSTGVQTLISVTEEVRHGLTVLDKDIQNFRRQISLSNATDDTTAKIEALIQKSIATIRDYEERAVEISRTIQKRLAEVDPMAVDNIQELTKKISLLNKEIIKTK
ncbi:MAG TPA: hypothetical protein PLY93_02905 [Turneriella sp.]|nr:hypothetical protein [Turneriella sp.]